MEKRRPRSVLPDIVLERVAQELDGSPRELLGVLMKLATYADLTGKPVTSEVAGEAIGSRNGERRRSCAVAASRCAIAASRAG